MGWGDPGCLTGVLDVPTDFYDVDFADLSHGNVIYLDNMCTITLC